MRYAIPFIVVLFSFASSAYSQKRWVTYAVSDKETRQYDTTSLSRQASYSQITIWEKITPSKDSLRAVRKEKYRDNDKDQRYLDYSYTLEEVVFDCSQKRYSFLDIIDYNTRGDSIGEFKDVFEWGEIIPDTISEFLFKIICPQ